jgi:hypothetical protein
LLPSSVCMSLSSNNTLQLTRAKTERELATPGTSPSARQAYGAAHGAAVLHTSSPGSEKASGQFLSPAMSPMAPVKTPNLGESPPVPPASTLPTTPLDNALIECVPHMHTAARCTTLQATHRPIFFPATSKHSLACICAHSTLSKPLKAAPEHCCQSSQHCPPAATPL